MQALGFKIVYNNGIPQLQSDIIEVGNINSSFAHMYEYIGCDMIEHVSIESLNTHNSYDLWVNENGAYENPLNFRFVGAYGPIDIYGDIIITSTHTDGDGNLVDDGLDDFTIKDITEMVMRAFGIQMIATCDMNDKDLDKIAY